MKIISPILGILSFALVLVLSSSPALAQFGALNAATPSATPTATRTATPTVRVGAPAATTPAAGNALPTLAILAASLVLLTTGVITWRKFSPKSA